MLRALCARNTPQILISPLSPAEGEVGGGGRRRGQAIPGAAAQVRQWAEGKLITPTFDIDGTIVLDLDKDELKKVLG